ncbi:MULTISPECIES: NAD-dependent succinate-semialdehyde dehydrogenase [unclassified Rhizobium]|uniref:NAD-dependent succinate-semialdehyde dehydrogenase n=1 Tax=unclassified Rhizobium TaxID=2613769 RepID=UPI00160BCB5A|nr:MULTISPECIES: NAD-dependent succinate-semialdehyde dehydrogenase [unclassified Rhizobium]MBB3319509.1 succinate-semialdehyde dehydrogenase/glutarate-semialdehyde dehydrogenase [Rhizobium sp. BK181]MBB3543397.1 succinate-semialdehyde dehydrogenase/glutarate-semialdehyde dehydrogenase [Rhizobium sp. BK399]MCS3743547.1 succinate-semialdehyde dehydrogenase/glutarate-semialdehyde dehydrogenase [Rhizobium sp. BK661]MCS4095239.1 succinate-semialdehyde dehydrogenase/glutarate-semialdehyde dehydrogen
MTIAQQIHATECETPDIDAAARGLYIDGSWRPSQSGRQIDVVDPSTGVILAAVPDATIEDAQACVDAAAASARAWRATPPRKRSEILRRCFELMVERSEMLATLISLENGKALRDARGEVAYAAEFFRWNAEEAVRITGEFGIAPSGTNRIIVDYQPIGICLMITPWNFPAAMATRKIAPALAAGCTVILKPASETPLTAYALAAIYEEAGVPKGVVNVLTTTNPGPVTAHVLADPRVRKLSFTGSTGVGKQLLAAAAKHVISCSMELGGNAPFVVFDDADLGAALDGAMIAKMRNAGEACTAANRFYVQSGIYDAFAEGLAKRMAALKVGPGINAETDCGPMITRKAVEKISRLVDDSKGKGARVLCGGEAPSGSGFFYPPTVLADVPVNSEMMSEEIFGPVAPLYRFHDEEEAIACANDTEYGLAAYVYTRDLARGLRVSSAIEAGMIALNRGLVSDPAAPFGGVKQSGLGREGGQHHGIAEFMEAKYIATSF